MSSKSWCVVLAVLGLVAFEVNTAFAAGRGISGSRVGGTVVVGRRTGWENSGHFPRTGNGSFGPTLAYGNAYWGWGGAGLGLGYGYGYPGWGYASWIAGYGYELVGVPYFAQFPPVYYGYEDNMPVVKASSRSSSAASEGSQPVTGPAPIPSPPRPPLRIVNPFYVEAQADKP
jgi:hypothetical protein